VVGFTYKGVKVSIPFTAEIPTDFRPGHQRAGLVQSMLDELDPWRGGEDPIQTNEFDQNFRALVVANDGRLPFWGVCGWHKAKQPELSPFIDLRSTPRTNLLTIELVDSPKKPRLVRVYPGDYTPPLPWQKSAHWADGGTQACREFWKKHSYVFAPNRIAHGTRTGSAPHWFRH